MVAPIANAMRHAKANNIGPFQQPGMDNQHDQFGAPIRHQEGAGMHVADAVASNAGEGLFSKAFMLAAGGFGLKHTIGRIKPDWAPKIASVTHGVPHALDKVSLSNFSLHNLKAAHAQAMVEHGEKFALKKTSMALYEPYKQKVASMGNVSFANAKWEGLGKLPKYLMNRGAFSTVMAGGLALATGLAFVRAGKHAKDGLDDLAEVVADIDGKNVSRIDLLRHPEKLSPAAQEIRANLIAHLTPDFVGAVGHGIENSAFAAMGGPAAHAVGGMMGGMGNMGIMMGGMMLGQGAHEFTPSLDLLHSYLGVKDIQAEGKTPPVELYAELMAGASAEVRRVGGVQSDQVMRIAQQYAEEGISAKALVAEMFDENKFKLRAQSVFEAMKDEQPEMEPEAAEAMPSAPNVTGVDMAASSEDVAEHANENEPPKLGALMQAQHDGKMHETQKEAAR
jgi:hypothetical protein